MLLIYTSPAARPMFMDRLSEKRGWRWRHAYHRDQTETPETVATMLADTASTVIEPAYNGKSYHPARDGRAVPPPPDVMHKPLHKPGHHTTAHR